MENLTDYSQFVFAAYVAAGALLVILAVATLIKFFSLKAKIKNGQ